MKKKIFAWLLFGTAVALQLFCSCVPNRWFLINTEGIVTYNRHTGQLEVLWNHHEEPNVWNIDTLRCDTIHPSK